MILKKSDLYFGTVKSPLNLTFMIFLFHYLFFFGARYLEKIILMNLLINQISICDYKHNKKIPSLVQKCFHPVACIQVPAGRVHFTRHALWTIHICLLLWHEKDSLFIVLALMAHSKQPACSLSYITYRSEYISFIPFTNGHITCSAYKACPI